jgi:hypothetical protein
MANFVVSIDRNRGGKPTGDDIVIYDHGRNTKAARLEKDGLNHRGAILHRHRAEVRRPGRDARRRRDPRGADAIASSIASLEIGIVVLCLFATLSLTLVLHALQKSRCSSEALCSLLRHLESTSATDA